METARDFGLSTYPIPAGPMEREQEMRGFDPKARQRRRQVERNSQEFAAENGWTMKGARYLRKDGTEVHSDEVFAALRRRRAS